jgi:hypothetical protein
MIEVEGTPAPVIPGSFHFKFQEEKCECGEGERRERREAFVDNFSGRSYLSFEREGKKK